MHPDTVISEISAIQVKLLYIHFKSVKINEDIQRTNSLTFSDLESPEAISRKGEIAYNLIDVIALFESYNSLIADIFQYPNIKKYLNAKLTSKLGDVQKRTAKWKYVRNKIGGHVDILPIQDFCKQYNYLGVFISNNLEADFKGVLILQMIESAINSTLSKSKLFPNELLLTTPSDIERLILKVNEDWKPCINLFEYINKLFYRIGRKDKLRLISKEDIGIIKF